MIGGRYRLGDRIGRGGMATVYRAHDEQLDRPVALKLMRSDLGEDTQFVRRFSSEARRAGSVNHPNVVAVYDFGTDENPYIVMELVDGGDVASLLRREGRLEPRHAARLAADAADALDAAHTAGLVHRDVKPGNLLVGRDGRARVADFGIARATGEDTMTRTGATLGSVEYFSPEQARGERVGPASDIYALGVVLYELLTGRRPFAGETPYSVATARLDRPAPDPREVVPELPADLAGIVTTAMAEAPGDRFGSAREMGDALRAWIAGSEAGAAATPPSKHHAAETAAVAVAAAPEPARTTPTRGSRASRDRRRGTWAAAALLLAGVAAVGFLAASLFGGPEQRLPGVVIGSPGGQALFDPTPTLTPTVAASPTPTVAASPTPTLTASPTPTATPTPETPAPTPEPAAPVPPAPEPPQPTPQPNPQPTPVVVAATTPDDAVAAFYSFVEAGRFDEAYALWSDRMKAQYPREQNLDQRFDDTVDITIDTLYVASQSGGTATVQANFTETYEGGSSRRFVGYWQLVQVDGRWLLDQPTY